MRLVMTRVFPDPAPARISKGPLTCRTARRCSGLRASRNVIGFFGTSGSGSAPTCTSLPSSRESELRVSDPWLLILSPDPCPPLFDRDALREIARLIDVAATADGNVIREQLERQDHGNRRQQCWCCRDFEDHVARLVEHLRQHV